MKLVLSLIICFMFLTGCKNNTVSNPADNINSYNSQSLSYSENFSNNSIENSDVLPDVPVEETISAFSTKISQKDPDRQTNITITCSSLNGTIVKSGTTFSFCNILGPAKPENGYKKADTFDSDGNIIQAYGGGKCQVSSTLYNAVLNAPGLTVIERNEHSGPVYYVEEGKDACVSYGSCDFQFRNDNNFDIKIYFSNTPDSLDVSIVKISS